MKIYSIKDFIRKTSSGTIDFERSKKIIRELAAASLSHPDHNILIDLRDTTVPVINMNEVIDITVEFISYLDAFKNKVANVVPKDDERISLAKKLEACLIMKGYQYKVFNDFEEAIEWLSEIENLDRN